MNLSYWGLKQNGSHFADGGIFKCNFLRENVCILFQFHLRWFQGVKLTTSHEWLRDWTDHDPIHNYILPGFNVLTNDQVEIWNLYCLSRSHYRNRGKLARVSGDLQSFFFHLKTSGGRLNIKMPSFQHRDTHVKDKTVSQPSGLATVLSLTWESPYLGKTVFILRWGPGHQQFLTYHKQQVICSTYSHSCTNNKVTHFSLLLKHSI